MLPTILILVFSGSAAVLAYALLSAPIDVQGCQLSDDDLEQIPPPSADGHEPIFPPPPQGGHP